jgi:hypothetical protein
MPMLIPRKYEADIRREYSARHPAGGAPDAAYVDQVILYGLDLARLDENAKYRMVLLGPDCQFFSPSDMRAGIRPDTLFIVSACPDELLALSGDPLPGRRAYGHFHRPADNDEPAQKKGLPSGYPLALSPVAERVIRQLAAAWGVSPQTALCAVLESACVDEREARRERS